MSIKLAEESTIVRKEKKYIVLINYKKNDDRNVKTPACFLLT